MLAYANFYHADSSAVFTNPEVYSRMLLWCESGSGDITVNGDRFSFSRDNYLILPWKHSITYRPAENNPFHLGGVHLIPHHSPSTPFKPMVAHNPGQKWWNDDELRDVEIPWLKKIVYGRFDEESVRLKNLGVHAAAIFHRPGFRRTTAASMALLIFEEIQYVMKKSPGELRVTEFSRFERITGYIRENISSKLSLGKLCETGAVSISSLRRLFIKSTGLPPHEWILQTRVEQACYLLRSTSEPVSEIALRTGFEDPSYFVRLFHKRKGVTPLKYRAAARKI